MTATAPSPASSKSGAAPPSPMPIPAAPSRAPASATSPPLSSAAGSAICSRRPGLRKRAEMADPEGIDPRLGWDRAPQRGWVSPYVAAEFPGLGIAWVEADARPGRSPDPVRRRLRELSDRFYGAH